MVVPEFSITSVRMAIFPRARHTAQQDSHKPCGYLVVGDRSLGVAVDERGNLLARVLGAVAFFLRIRSTGRMYAEGKRVAGCGGQWLVDSGLQAEAIRKEFGDSGLLHPVFTLVVDDDVSSEFGDDLAASAAG